MKFKIHFEIGDFHDYFIVEGDTIEEVKEKANAEERRRGLDEDENNLWSEEIK
jgi:hypothetical protein